MAEKKWVMVRLEEHVHAALVALRHRLMVARDGCHPCLQRLDSDASLSEIVMRLVSHHLNDSRRKKVSRLRVQARKRLQRMARPAGE